MSEIVGRVAEIHRYPVKSMQGEQPESASLDRLGVVGDRRFAVRDVDNGKILSAKVPAVGRVLLAFAARYGDADTVVVRIGDTDYSSDDTAGIDVALSERLNRRAHLEPATGAPETYESYWPEVEGVVLSDVTIDLPIAGSTEPGAFVDVAPLHVVATASVARLRELAPGSVVDIARFRPNLVIELGAKGGGFVENDWADATASVGSAVIRFTSVTPRCVMTTLPQPNLPADRAILQTLAAHNRLDYEGLGNFGCLGVYADVVQPGEVRTGDEFTLSAGA